MPKLIRVARGYRCSNCYISQPEPFFQCRFCQQFMSNYESIMVENFKYGELDNQQNLNYNNSTNGGDNDGVD